MSKLKKPLSSGFTLIELVLYMGLVSIFLVVVTDLFVSILQNQLQLESTSAVDQDAQYLIARLTSDIHRAASVSTPATPGTTSYSLVMEIQGVTYTYGLVGNRLQLTTSGVNYILNSFGSQTTGFSVTRIGYQVGTPTFQIHFDLTGTSLPLNQQPVTRSYQITVGLR